MLEAADHHLTMAEGQVLPQSSVYEASAFSSWGVSPDLRLKPEIAAPGGNVFSAIPNGAYEQTSGTSMATPPQMAGISAIVLQCVQSAPLFASMSAREKVDVVQNLIMGTATPVTDPAQDTGVYYSPRKQGAGLVDALAATTSSVYPTVEGAPEQSRPKADLGMARRAGTSTSPCTTSPTRKRPTSSAPRRSPRSSTAAISRSIPRIGEAVAWLCRTAARRREQGRGRPSPSPRVVRPPSASTLPPGPNSPSMSLTTPLGDLPRWLHPFYLAHREPAQPDRALPGFLRRLGQAGHL